MTLSKEVLEALAYVDNKKAELDQALAECAEAMAKATDGFFEICRAAPSNMQLYHCRELSTSAEALEFIKDIADDGHVEVRWSDEIQTCYAFKIDRHECIILLDKEDISNE